MEQTTTTTTATKTSTTTTAGERASGVPATQGQIFKDRGHRATATIGRPLYIFAASAAPLGYEFRNHVLNLSWQVPFFARAS